MNSHRGSVEAVYDNYTQPTATCFNQENGSGSYPNFQVVPVGPFLYDGRLDFSNFTGYWGGTNALCETFFQNPIYFAFDFLYFVNASDPYADMAFDRIPGFSVGPGDSISSALISSRAGLTFTITDQTRTESFSKTIAASGFRANAGGCLMIPFGNIPGFSAITQHCRATVEDVTSGIGDFPSPNAKFRWFTQNFVDGTTTQDSTSSLSSDGATFTIAWVTSKPLQTFTGGFPTGEGFPSAIQDSLFPGSHAAGYLLLNSPGDPVQAVSDSYTQPAATCASLEGNENATGHYPDDQNAIVGAALYAGSLNFSRFRLYQVGTEALCPSFYRAPMYVPYYLLATVTPSDPDGDFVQVAFPGFSVNPGDAIRAIVISSPSGSREDGQGGIVTFLLADLTTGRIAWATVPMPGPATNGASCLMEPIGNTVQFAKITQSCKVRVHGETQGIGETPGENLLLRFNLLSPGNSMIVQVRTSGLTQDGTTFTVSWVSSMPLYH